VTFEGFARLSIGVVRSMMLVLAVVVLVDYMIDHPKKAERSVTSVVFPLLILVTREGIRWDK